MDTILINRTRLLKWKIREVKASGVLDEHHWFYDGSFVLEGQRYLRFRVFHDQHVFIGAVEDNEKLWDIREVAEKIVSYIMVKRTIIPYLGVL